MSEENSHLTTDPAALAKAVAEIEQDVIADYAKHGLDIPVLVDDEVIYISPDDLNLLPHIAAE
ncbi:MAG: hypothetical protein AAGJ85_01165 [Pseudomonadota bacterium]